MRKLFFLLALLTSCKTQCDVNVTSSKVDASVQEFESSAPEPVVESQQKIAERRILIVGDSEACAVSWQVKRVKLPTDTVDVECKGGTTVPYWGSQGHLKMALDKHLKPDVLLVFLGTNHYGQVVTPDVKPILDIIKDRELTCMWIGNTAVKGKKWKINKLIRDAVTPTCSYFDTEEANIPLPDGVHPDGIGAVKWLKLIWATLPVKYEESDE